MALDGALVAEALPRYEIGDEIGRGGWGVVLRGTHRDLGREVAIKVLARAFGADPVVRERFIEEARLVARLDHPHIVPLFDYVEHEGVFIIVMEFAHGGTLWDRFASTGLTPDTAVATVLAAAVGLHHAHERGVLHRDVKPDNILFTRDGIAKIADFGIAKAISDEAARLTATNSTVGTPAYMAPEQASGGALSPATDVYSLGVMLYELLTGERPYPPVAQPTAQMLQHLTEAPRPMSDVLPGVHPELERVVLSALEKDSDDRPPSAEDFAVDLAAAGAGAFGPGWLAAGDHTVMSATRVVGASEHPPDTAAAPVDRDALTISVRATRGHPRLGGVVSDAPARRTPPPASSPGGSPPAPPPPPPPPARPSPVVSPSPIAPAPVARRTNVAAAATIVSVLLVVLAAGLAVAAPWSDDRSGDGGPAGSAADTSVDVRPDTSDDDEESVGTDPSIRADGLPADIPDVPLPDGFTVLTSSPLGGSSDGSYVQAEIPGEPEDVYADLRAAYRDDGFAELYASEGTSAGGYTGQVTYGVDGSIVSWTIYDGQSGTEALLSVAHR